MRLSIPLHLASKLWLTLYRHSIFFLIFNRSATVSSLTTISTFVAALSFIFSNVSAQQVKTRYLIGPNDLALSPAGCKHSLQLAHLHLQHSAVFDW